MEPKKDGRTVSEDAFFHSPFAMGVADGVGSFRRRGIDASVSSRSAMRAVCNRSIRGEREGKPASAMDLMYEAYAAATMVQGATTVCIAAFRSPMQPLLEVSTLGDSGCLVIRNGELLMVTREQWHEFDFPWQMGPTSPDQASDAEKYIVEVRAGDVVICASDGVLDNVYASDIAQCAISPSFSSTHAIARAIVDLALQRSQSLDGDVPYNGKAMQHGVPRTGGKEDDITCVVSFVGHSLDKSRQDSEHSP